MDKGRTSDTIMGIGQRKFDAEAVEGKVGCPGDCGFDAGSVGSSLHASTCLMAGLMLHP